MDREDHITIKPDIRDELSIVYIYSRVSAQADWRGCRRILVQGILHQVSQGVWWGLDGVIETQDLFRL